MNAGDKCICQYDDWYNGFGESHHAVHQGMRLTVKSRHNIAGTVFYEFEETPEKFFYLSHGFKSMRQLN